MPYYEYVVVTRQNFLQDNRPDELLKKVSGWMGDHGKIIRHEYWGLRGLQYVIKRKRRGHFAVLYIDAAPDTIISVRKKMSIDDNILRYLVNKIENIPQFVSPLNVDYEAALAESAVAAESTAESVGKEGNQSDSKPDINTDKAE